MDDPPSWEVDWILKFVKDDAVVFLENPPDMLGEDEDEDVEGEDPDPRIQQHCGDDQNGVT